MLLAGLCFVLSNGCLNTESGEQAVEDGGVTSLGPVSGVGTNAGTTPQPVDNGNGTMTATISSSAAGNENLIAAETTSPNKTATQAYIGSLFNGECLDVHKIAGQYDVNLYSCADKNGGQQWNVLANGKVQWVGDPTLCLSVSTASNAAKVPLTLTSCDTAAAQTWSADGVILRHLDSDRCVATGRAQVVEPDGLLMDGLALAPCDANLLFERWYVGPYVALGAKYNEQLAKRTMQQKCSPEVYLVPYSATDAGAKRVVARYGSDAKLLAFVRQALLEDCNAMFLAATEAPKRRSVGVAFDDVCTGGALTGPMGTLNPTMSICSKFFATIDETEMPLTLRLDAMIHHELTHALDTWYGKPFGIREGYANLVVYRTNYLYNNQRVKGGNWTDGYSTTTFFFLWLDNTFARKPVGQRFTDSMQQRGRDHADSQDDPNWFLPWVKQETGFTIDQLWAKYQASF